MRLWASLLVLVAVSAFGATHINQLPSGINWSKWGLATGPVNCHELDPTAQDGDFEYCSPVDGGPGCVEGSDPCACAAAGTGDTKDVFAYRDHGRWRCDGTGGQCFTCDELGTCLGCTLNGGTCTVGTQCCSGVCTLGTCRPLDLCTDASNCPCVPINGICNATRDCCEGFCLDGSCVVGATVTTTSSTTSTSTSSSTSTSTSSTSTSSTTSTSTSTLNTSTTTSTTTSTSTSTSSSTTSSSTSTSTSTTTLLDVGMWLPTTAEPTAISASTVGLFTAHTMHCTDFVPGRDATNMTKLAFYLFDNSSSGAGTSLCTIAIYNAGGSSLLTSVSKSCNGGVGAGVEAETGITPFSLSAGTEYRVCYCTGAANFEYLVTRDGVASGGSVFHAYNAIVTNNGTAANSCDVTTNVPPATTGALAADQIEAAIVYVTKE